MGGGRDRIRVFDDSLHGYYERDIVRGGMHVDLVADQEVGSMNGLRPLMFWAILSLAAVVVGSYQPTTSSSIEVAQAQTASVSKTTAPRFPVQAFGPGAQPSPAAVVMKPSAVVTPPMVYPKGYVAQPMVQPGVAKNGPLPLTPPARSVAPKP